MSRALVSAPSEVRAATSPGVDVLAGAIACVMVWLLFLPFTSLGIDPYHDGLMLKPAVDVLSGQTLFRDTLMMYGPLTTWIQATAMALIAPTLRVLRLSTVFAYGIAAGATVMCWRLVLPRSLVLLAGALWMLFSPIGFGLHPWPSAYAMGFQALALLALLCALHSPAARAWALASGLMAGLALLSRQLPTGVVCIVAVVGGPAGIALVFPSYRRRGLQIALGAAVGIAIVVAALLLHLLWQGALQAWWEQTIVWAWRWSQASQGAGIRGWLCLDLWLPYGAVFGAVTVVGLGLIRLGRPSASALAFALAAAWALFVYRFGYVEAFGQGVMPIALLLAAVATTAVALRERRAPRRETMLALAALIMCIGSWSQAYPLGDPGHLFWGISLSYGFSVLVAWQLGGRRTMLVAALLVLLWAPFAVNKVDQWRRQLTAERVTLTEPPLLAGMRERPHRAAHWARLANALRWYSWSRRRWPMLLEGENLVAVSLARDLSNSDPYVVRFHHVPYDEESRARFIRRERPLIFSEQPAGPVVQQAIDEVGYETLTVLPDAVVLAPVTKP